MERPLPKGRNQNVIGLMKDELYEKITKEFVGLKAKSYSYVIDNGSEKKEQKAQKSVP